MSQNRICFSSVLKAKGAEQSANQQAKRFVRAMGKKIADTVSDTAISRKVVGKNVHATIPKGNMEYDQYTVPDTVTVEPTFVAFH